MIKFGNNDTKLYLGANEVTSIYLGSTQVYDGGDTPTPPTPTPYDEQYLTFEALESGTFTLTIGSAVTDVVSVSYSLDSGETWTTTNNAQGRRVVITTPTVNAGDEVLWKGNALKMANKSNQNSASTFSSTANFNARGNVMSLLYGDEFKGKVSLSGKNYCFCWLFHNNTKLTNGKNISLPATTLANDCYYGMFYGCKNLTTAPELPATTLANDCYYYMFYGCSGLTAAPELSATTLASNCYRNMFQACTSLNYIKCLATDISASTCTGSWVSNVAASGTFVKAASMSSWTTGVNGIPDGWTVQNDDGSSDVPIDDGGGNDPGFDDQE